MTDFTISRTRKFLWAVALGLGLGCFVGVRAAETERGSAARIEDLAAGEAHRAERERAAELGIAAEAGAAEQMVRQPGDERYEHGLHGEIIPFAIQ